MSLIGVQNAMNEAEKNVNGREIESNIDLEREDNSEEIWDNIEEGPMTESIPVETQVDHLENIIQNLSVEVAMGTDKCYRRFYLFFNTRRLRKITEYQIGTLSWSPLQTCSVKLCNGCTRWAYRDSPLFLVNSSTLPSGYSPTGRLLTLTHSLVLPRRIRESLTRILSLMFTRLPTIFCSQCLSYTLMMIGLVNLYE